VAVVHQSRRSRGVGQGYFLPCLFFSNFVSWIVTPKLTTRDDYGVG
jgi:hypothetical protein